MSPEATYVLQSLATIAVFGGAVYVALWSLRRASGGARGRGALEVLARQPLDGRRAIYLVRVGKKVLIVGASDSSLTRLGSTSLASLEGELAKEEQSTFRHALDRALGRDDRKE